MVDAVTTSLDILLGDLGDRARQRQFRMNITICRHRALTQAEVDALPPEWHDAKPRDIAGGPVAVQWAVGVPDVPSIRPCHNPGHKMLVYGRPDLWFPEDCGTCPPCIARSLCHA